MNGILYMNVSILENQMLFDKWMSLVSKERNKKVKQFRNPLPARLSLGAGILLRIAMDQCRVSDKLNDIEYGEFGKPYLKNSDFHFSLSHSGEYVVCVYGDKPLGMDLQQVKENIPKHTKKILSDEELLYLNSSDDAVRVNNFYEIWARKESLIKWDGRGLRIPLTEINTVKQNKLAESVQFEEKYCFFMVLDFLMPNYTVCICSEKRSDWNHKTEITLEFLTKY